MLFLVGLVAASAAAGAGALNEADREAIRAVIARQIEAFRRDDAVGAFAFAAPGIKAKFGTPARFMEMVRAGYGPLVRPREVRFAALDESGPAPVQRVLVIGAGGRAFLAHYPMERQADGRWLIAGCYLVRLEATEA